MSTPNDGWDNLGTHFIRFDEPDIVVCRLKGAVTAADVQAGAAYMEKTAARIGRGIFYLSIMTDLTHYSPSTAAKTFKEPPTYLRASAMCGASYHQRALFGAINRATRLLGLEWSKLPVEMFADEASARAWIDELRRKG